MSIQPVGEDKKIPYSDVKTKRAYIPEVESNGILYPLIACPTDNLINTRFFSWRDDERSYDYYDLSRDLANVLTIDQNVERLNLSKKVLGSVSYWAPQSLD